MIGKINSVETMGLVDGPGIRFVVFLQGCKLRCIFCHNPETWSNVPVIEITPEELVDKILRYKPYFENNGGVTFSGGEPLLQPEFLLETCKLLKKENIHISLDTSGVGIGNYEEILKYIDLVILDIKAYEQDIYNKVTGSNINEFLTFLNVCTKLNKKLWLRQVIIPGINDNKEYIKGLKIFTNKIPNVEKIEFLPFHTLGKEKYKKLNIINPLEKTLDMSKEKCNELFEYFNKI
jgi:pyruvate formate lyase activating enzyme